MKVIIYKNPVMSAVILNIISLIIVIFSISEKAYVLQVLVILVGLANRKIIDNGENIDKQKKVTIYVSFFLMLSIFISYSIYIIYHY